MSETIIIDEDEDIETVCDPFGHGREDYTCPSCHQPMGFIRFTTSWCHLECFCSPACRDEGVARAMRERRRYKRRLRAYCKQVLEEAQKHRCIVVPRSMFTSHGYRVWKGKGKPASPCHKQDGKWVRYDSRRCAIDMAYSADVFAQSNGSIRKPVALGNELFTYMGGTTWDFKCAVGAWKLVAPEEFSGPTFTYNEKCAIPHSDDDYCGGAYCRRDPMGFYHGMTAKHGKQTYVIQGPKVFLLRGPREAKKQKQKSLF
jgi:hypothetical protein